MTYDTHTHTHTGTPRPPVKHTVEINIACKQHLDSRCVRLLSDPSTFGAGVPTKTCLGFNTEKLYIWF